MIRLIAFDLDGTIGDTVPMCIQACKKAVEPYIMRELSNAEIEQTLAISIALITGKGERSCDITLRKFGMENCFDQIITGNPQRNTKSDAIRNLLHKRKLQPCEMLYIGDAVSDISACVENNVCCLSAAWAAPDKIASDLEERNQNRVFYSIRSLNEFLSNYLCKS